MIPEAAAIEAPPSGSLVLRAAAALQRFLSRAATARRERKLRLCETLPLGEKRFLAVVQVNRQQFLVGATANAISLLKELPSATDIASEGPDSASAAR